MDALVKAAPKALAKKAPKGAGLVLMNQAVEQIASALATQQRLRPLWESSICTIGSVGEPRNIELARKIHKQFLAQLPEMAAAESTLLNIFIGGQSIDRARAMLMLNVLFAAIGKRKSDEENAMLLMAAADMFNPINDVLAAGGLLDPPVSTGNKAKSVKPINRHPAILAIAVKKLIATAKFTSAAELREAMADVQHFLGLKLGHLDYMTTAIHCADKMLFAQEPAIWKELHLRDGVDVAVERKMQVFEADAADEPGSPRWEALEQLVKAKEAATSSMREAACEAKPPVKRTRKPRARV